ncbi:hypothetical protein M885DRAFT_567532 [Pelagophyceae sp. CCMP2097]|nr:hypothetical protein M885DRAFT_567532 [Pelagophyceae sp. CCMP2097]
MAPAPEAGMLSVRLGRRAELRTDAHYVAFQLLPTSTHRYAADALVDALEDRFSKRDEWPAGCAGAWVDGDAVVVGCTRAGAEARVDETVQAAADEVGVDVRRIESDDDDGAHARRRLDERCAAGLRRALRRAGCARVVFHGEVLVIVDGQPCSAATGGAAAGSRLVECVGLDVVRALPGDGGALTVEVRCRARVLRFVPARLRDIEKLKNAVLRDLDVSDELYDDATVYVLPDVSERQLVVGFETRGFDGTPSALEAHNRAEGYDRWRPRCFDEERLFWRRLAGVDVADDGLRHVVVADRRGATQAVPRSVVFRAVVEVRGASVAWADRVLTKLRHKFQALDFVDAVEVRSRPAGPATEAPAVPASLALFRSLLRRELGAAPDETPEERTARRQAKIERKRLRAEKREQAEAAEAAQEGSGREEDPPVASDRAALRERNDAAPVGRERKADVDARPQEDSLRGAGAASGGGEGDAAGEKRRGDALGDDDDARSDAAADAQEDAARETEDAAREKLKEDRRLLKKNGAAPSDAALATPRDAPAADGGGRASSARPGPADAATALRGLAAQGSGGGGERSRQDDAHPRAATNDVDGDDGGDGASLNTEREARSVPGETSEERAARREAKLERKRQRDEKREHRKRKRQRQPLQHDEAVELPTEG